jgi:hypothetical protein
MEFGEAPGATTTIATGFLVGNRCTLDKSEKAARNARRLADPVKLTVVGLTPCIDTGDVTYLRPVLAIAVACGAPQVRLQEKRTTYRSMYAEFLAFPAVAGYAGVRLVVEIHHKTIAPSVGSVKPLFSYFDPNPLGVVNDAQHGLRGIRGLPRRPGDPRPLPAQCVFEERDPSRIATVIGSTTGHRWTTASLTSMRS